MCTNGVALPLDQSCDGSCNYHPSDERRDYESSRSHVAACVNTNTCAKEGIGSLTGATYIPTICTGDSSCEGELAWCKNDERKNEICQFGFTRCSPTLGGSKKKVGESSLEANRIPGQCINPAEAEEGSTYHCLDRTDENPFKGAGSGENQTKMDFSKLKNCTKDGFWRLEDGLECGDKKGSNCVGIGRWCMKDSKSQSPEKCPVLGEGVFTNHPSVCQNYMFWHGRQCEAEDRIRCRTRYSGQCALNIHWGAEVVIKGFNCKDGSDLYRPIVKEEPTNHRKPSETQEV